MMSKITHKYQNEVLDSLLPDPQDYYPKHVKGLKGNGSQLIGLCPFQDDHNPSFSINTDTGEYYCHGCEVRGTGVLGFHMKMNDMDYLKAAEDLGALQKCKNNTSKKQISEKNISEEKDTPFSNESVVTESSNNDWLCVSVPEGEKPPLVHQRLGLPVESWTYRNESGGITAYVCRFDIISDKKVVDKQFRPRTFWKNTKTGKQEWRWEAPPSPRPLYNLAKIIEFPDATLVVCEGEKATNAAKKIYPEPKFIVTTSMNGAKSASKSDWKPAKGRIVYLFPDHDEAGKKYMQDVGELIHAFGDNNTMLFLLNLDIFKNLPNGTKRESLPEGYDAADAIGDGFTADNIQTELFKRAIFLKAIKNSDNKWDAAKIPFGFSIDDRGVFEENDKERIKISGPVWVSARTCSPDGKDAWGIIINWIDLNNKFREMPIPSGFLYDGPLLAKTLADQGLLVIPGKERKLCVYLSKFNIAERIYSVEKLGWVDCDNLQLSYVTNTDVISNSSLENKTPKYVFQPEKFSSATRSFIQHGSFEEWQKNVLYYCKGNPLLIFALLVSLVGPLLKFINIESIGIHFFGRSSLGKTTLAQVAASLIGCGGDPADMPDSSYIKRWNSTGNGFEGLAAAHNDGTMILDELGTSTTKNFNTVIYNLTGGQGKIALDTNRSLKKQRTWRIALISTGEISIKEKIEEDGVVSKAGQLLRVIDIPVQNIFQDTHGMETAVFVNTLKKNCSMYYGGVIRLFIQRLVDDPRFSDSQLLRKHITNLTETIKGNLRTEGLQPEQGRVVDKFLAVQAIGHLAVDLGLFKEGNIEYLTLIDVEKAVSDVCNSWLAESCTMNDVTRGVIAVREFIFRNETRFKNKNKNNVGDIVRDKVGYIDPGNKLYLFTVSGFQESCVGYNYKEVAGELNRLGFLYRNNGNRNLSKHSPCDTECRANYYAVKQLILEYSPEEELSEVFISGTAGTAGQS